MFDLTERWIFQNGELVRYEQLSDKIRLGRKQAKFASLFSQEVFDTYNEMGYYYLSNVYYFDKERRTKHMSREALA